MIHPDLAKFTSSISLKFEQTPISNKMIDSFMKEVNRIQEKEALSDISQNSKDCDDINENEEAADKQSINNKIKFTYEPGKHSRADSNDIKEIYCLIEDRISKEQIESTEGKSVKIDLNQFKHFLKRAQSEAIDKLIKGEITYQQLKANVLRHDQCNIEALDDFKAKYGKEFFIQDDNFK